MEPVEVVEIPESEMSPASLRGKAAMIARNLYAMLAGPSFECRAEYAAEMEREINRLEALARARES